MDTPWMRERVTIRRWMFENRTSSILVRGANVGRMRRHFFAGAVRVAGANGRRPSSALARSSTSSRIASREQEKSVMSQIPELITYALLLACAVISVWMAGAIYYDVCDGARWGRWVALGWAVVVIAMFAAWRPLWQPTVALLGAESLFLAWWLRQKPSHKRNWSRGGDVLPRAVSAGDAVTIENVRNFEYRSLDDFAPGYETRTVRLSNLEAADVIFFNWSLPWMGHPVLVFDFGRDGRLCMSIEARLRKGQVYSFVRSLYRQQELIFLVADERDVILRRTKYSQGQRAYLYRLNAPLDELRTVFLDYVSTINSLYESPRWYHGLMRQLHHVVLPVAQPASPLGLARDCQRPTGPSPV